MGICYEIKMKDDFNWEYVGTSKKERLGQFADEIEKLGRPRPELIAEWYGHAIFDLCKTAPYIQKYGEIILKYCDVCHYWGDSQDEELRKLKKEDLLTPPIQSDVR